MPNRLLNINEIYFFVTLKFGANHQNVTKIVLITDITHLSDTIHPFMLSFNFRYFLASILAPTHRLQSIA